MKILIVEDEPVVARRISQLTRRLLEPRLTWLGVAPDFESAEQMLASTPVDILILDLNLAGRDGMRLLDAPLAGAFHTIIVSANTEHALAAFERGVIDFVAKPFTEERLGEALRRVTDPAGRSPHAAKCLAIRKNGRIEIVRMDDVVYIRGADDFSELVLTDGRRELHDKSLEGLQRLLPADFQRIHKSFLVRMTATKALHVREGGRYELELSGGENLPVGRTRYRAVRERLL